jgi:hypothetical protein
MGIRRLLLIVPLVLSCLGIKEWYVYCKNPEPKEISIDELMFGAPDAEWIRITGAKMDLAETLILENRISKRAEELYIPLRPHPGEEGVVRICALFRTKDPELLQLADKFRAAENSADVERKVIELTLNHADLMIQQRPFEGLVEFGLNDSDKRVYQLKKRLHQLDDRPVVLQDGEKPSIIRGSVIVLVSAVMFLIIWLRTARTTTPPRFTPSPPPLPGSAV